MRIETITILAGLGMILISGGRDALGQSITDEHFFPSDWEFVSDDIGPGGTSVVTRETTGGNPGGYRRVEIDLPSASGESRHFGFHKRLGFSWSPDTQGAITSIQYSVDVRQFSGQQTVGLVIFQGGDIFIEGHPSGVGSAWETDTMSLVEENFSLYVGAPGEISDPSVHPDFSRTGAPLEFGFLAANGNPTGSGSLMTALGFDNWSVSLSFDAVGFIRGDLDGNGSADSLDAPRLQAYLFPVSAAIPYETPTACDGSIDQDVADVNDNEFLTIADYVLLRDSQILSPAPVVPGPDSCDSDPTDDTRGFLDLDPDYSVTFGDPVVMGDPDGVRQVFFPINLDYPAGLPGVHAFTIILTADPVLTPPSSYSWVGQGLGTVETYGNTVVLTRYANFGSFLSESPGTLILELEPFAVFPPLAWEPEFVAVAASGREVHYRATVVDPDYVDHHPSVVIGDYEFVRGNANGDTAVDLADAIYLLDFLFRSMPAPYCDDAGDVNNDSTVNIGDPIYLLSFLFSGGPPIPAPYPQCGFDDGQIDRLGCAPPGDACN